MFFPKESLKQVEIIRPYILKANLRMSVIWFAKCSKVIAIFVLSR